MWQSEDEKFSKICSQPIGKKEELLGLLPSVSLKLKGILGKTSL
jgi:hypothetical protein